MKISKICSICGKTYNKRSNCGSKRWEHSECCSNACKSKWLENLAEIRYYHDTEKSIDAVDEISNNNYGFRLTEGFSLLKEDNNID